MGGAEWGRQGEKAGGRWYLVPGLQGRSLDLFPLTAQAGAHPHVQGGWVGGGREAGDRQGETARKRRRGYKKYREQTEASPAQSCWDPLALSSEALLMELLRESWVCVFLIL